MESGRGEKYKSSCFFTHSTLIRVFECSRLVSEVYRRKHKSLTDTRESSTGEEEEEGDEGSKESLYRVWLCVRKVTINDALE